jgi:hypothetical protein
MIRTPQEPRRGSPSNESDESKLDNVLPRNREETNPRHESDEANREETDPRHESDESNLDNVLPINREETDPPKP